MTRDTWILLGVLLVAAVAVGAPGPMAPVPAQPLSSAGPPLVPAGMQLRGWYDTSAEAVDGWIPFTFRTSVPPDGVTSVEFYLTVQPIGQLTETDSFYCLDHEGKGVALYTSFGNLSTGTKHIVHVFIDQDNDPGILHQLQSGALECVLQDDTALFAAQMVLNPAPTTDFASPREAMDYLEKKYPAKNWEGRWIIGLRDDERFKRYIQKIKQQDMDLFYEVQDMIRHRHEFYPGQRNMERLPDSQSDDYFCHDFAWRTGPTRRQKVDPSTEPLPITNRHIDPNSIMEDEEAYGFEEIDPWAGDAFRELKPGDVVVYLNEDGTAAHSAVVARINPDGIENEDDVILLSKDVRNAIFRHTLGQPGEPNFFRDEFAAGGMAFYTRK